MVQDSGFWGGLVTGDAASTDILWAAYSDDMHSDLFRKLFTRDRTAQGVIGGYANELEVTDAGGTTMRVAAGAALVDGKFYENTANVDNVSSGNAVYWLIGLTKNWAAQTVRIFARGTYGSEAAALAALVQTDGTTWEIPLATVLTTAGGDVDVVTDQRKWAIQPSTKYLAFAPYSGYNVTDTTVIVPAAAGLGYLFPTNKLSRGYGICAIPGDYLSDLTIQAIVAPDDDGDLYNRISANLVECGEVGGGPINPFGTDAVLTVNKECVALMVAADFAVPIIPGHILSMAYERDGLHASDTITGVYLRGFLITYTPIS